MKSPNFKFFILSFLLISIFSCNSKNTTATQKTDNAVPPTSAKFDLSKVDSAKVMEDVKHLSSDELEGRGSGSKGNDLAREYIVKRFEELGLEKTEDSFSQPFTFIKRKKEYNCNNIVGKIEGTKFKEKHIVLTAHYDHLGIHDGKIFNGADDNASGVAAVMEAAAYFKKNPPRHSILFVAFDAEELGLEGAKYFVKNSPVSLDNILMNINLDMISRNKKNEIYLCGTHHYPILKEKLTHIDEASPLNVLFGHDTPDLGFNDWTHSSDHSPFHQKKIPFLYLGVEDHEDYHKHTDTFEKIDQSFLYRSTNLVIDILNSFDKK